MLKTEPADYIGKENLSYILLAFLSGKNKDRISNFLRDIQSEFPDLVWAMPEEAMHITLCEIVQPKEYTQDKTNLYNLHRDEYENIPDDVFAKCKNITVTFDTVEVTPQAIIIKGRDDGSFELVRNNLVKALPFPEETKAPPTIIHSSIARYLAEEDLEQIDSVVRKHKLAFVEEIKEFKLVRSEIQPLLQYETLRTYSLDDLGNIS